MVGSATNPYTQRYSRDVVTVDLADLGLHLLKHWKSILAVALAGAVLAGGYGVFKADREINGAAEILEKQLGKTVETLSEQEIAEAEDVYTQLKNYDAAIRNQQAYNAQSFVMQMDPESAVGVSARYVVTTELDNISNVYDGTVLTDADADQIAGLFGTGRSAVPEIVTFSSLSSEGAKEINLTQLETQSGSVDKDYHLFLTVSILAPSESACSDALTIVDQAVERRTKELKDQGIRIACDRLEDAASPNAYTRIVTSQQSKMNTLASLLTNRTNYQNNVVAKLTAGQQDYIRLMRKGDGLAGSVPVSYWKKYALIGLLAGAFLMLCLYSFLYVIRGCIHTAGDLEEGLGIPVIKDVRKSVAFSKRKVAADTAAGYAETSVALTSALTPTALEIASQAEAAGMKRIYVATETDSEAAVQAAQIILKQMEGKPAATIGSFRPGTEEMKTLLSSDAVFIIAAADRTAIKDVRSFRELADRNDKPILGAVLTTSETSGRKAAAPATAGRPETAGS